ncbi:MAG: replication-associated recombination protein A [Actinomycetota bacterium]
MADRLFPDPGEKPEADPVRLDAFAPLAARMRPRSLDELVGQDELVGPGRPLRLLIESDRPGSMILWGPAGTGKTSLARLVAAASRARFVQLSAVSATVADVRKTIASARETLRATGRRTILFIDEIHRFNKTQQDALLPAVEAGEVILIGATTENPYFQVNPPLISRSLLFRLEPLGEPELRGLMERALADSERGLGASGVQVLDEAVDHIASQVSGDARAALNVLEASVAAALAAGEEEVGVEAAEQALQHPVLHYGDDAHYDVVSAFIKSMRGSDPDAAVWWLARMLEAGEDPRFIARRIVIFASEDVGNADPTALLVAVAAAHALELVGLPEAQLNLAQAVTYLASAPKSNASTVAIGRATADVRALGEGQVPSHLRDAHYQGARRLGHGKGYEYPHDHPGGWVAQDYLPEELRGRRYYEPTDRGAEAEIRERLDRLRARRNAE